MSVLLTGAGGLFTRLGQYVDTINAINTFRGGSSAGQLVKEVNDVLAQLDGDTDTIRATVAGVLSGLPQGQAALTALQKAIQTAAQNLLVAQVNADTPLATQDVAHALTVLKSQMLTAGDYVNPNTLGYTVTPAAGNAGNGAIAVGLRNARGFQLDNLLAELTQITVASNATAGSETLNFQGAAAVSDRLNWAWPAGSGSNQNLTSLAVGAANNSIAGGDFENFTGNTPNFWTAVAGTPGTDFKQSAAASGFTGSTAFEFVGGTGVLSQITQNLASLKSRTPYAINCWLKADVVPASGTLILDLYNGSSVIQDEAGNNCSLSIALNGLTTSYVAHNAVWQIADPLPATVTLRARLSVAIPAGSNIFLDTLAFQAAKQLSSNPNDAPYVAVFGGSANWSLKDTLTLTTTNNRTCKWQQGWNQLFDDGKSGFLLPTTGTTLINDSLIS